MGRGINFYGIKGSIWGHIIDRVGCGLEPLSAEGEVRKIKGICYAWRLIPEKGVDMFCVR